MDIEYTHFLEGWL